MLSLKLGLAKVKVTVCTVRPATVWLAKILIVQCSGEEEGSFNASQVALQRASCSTTKPSPRVRWRRLALLTLSVTENPERFVEGAAVGAVVGTVVRAAVGATEGSVEGNKDIEGNE